jgi:Asp-tRNA(Asn)/Glu-tRNA(Gln) amidotransferase A subunit family amidase
VDPSALNWLSATDAARGIADGAITSEQLVESCLTRIRETDPQVEAWTFLDPAYALEQARARDEERRTGTSVGPLHGVPVGVKDIFDTGDMPTEDGTVLHAGRTPAADAAAVTRLRRAGAVILGKTVTTECAYFSPGKTRNPHNPAHTPGGSSSGSAAAVGAGMVPVALGSQTNGSVIRPAAFCGVFGFKPTHGLISRHGVLKLSRSLDHVGFFSRTIEDLALLAEVLASFDVRDPDTRPLAHIPFRATAAQEPPLAPSIAFVKTSLWDRVEPDAQEAFSELVDALGEHAVEVPLEEDFMRDALDWHRVIMETEMAANLNLEWERGRDRLSEQLRGLLGRGRAILALEYQQALARRSALNDALAPIFDRFDAILTPAARGTAPEGLGSTGDPAFCTAWTLCGTPAVTLPLMRGENGLPLGVQLVGPRDGDARLLRTARWVCQKLGTED